MKITSDSHMDHSLTQSHIDFIKAKYASVESFKLETIELSPELSSLPCGLHGPLMGDDPIPEREITYKVRGSRDGESRMCKRGVRKVRTMTVIMGPYEGECILYTAFGGPSAPREPFDPGLDDKGREESRKFWSEHALSE